MERNNPQINEILGMIKSGQITSEEGFTQIKSIQARDSSRTGEENTANHREIAVDTGNQANERRVQDIAIIGMSGQFSHAVNVDEFWKNLSVGKDMIREFPKDRWDMEKFFNSDLRDLDRRYFKWGGFLSEIDRFDPLFFNISPREAEVMDPQQRLFLQEAWKALEDAGYSDRTLSEKKCGVFVGCSSGEYNSQFTGKELTDVYTFPGNSSSILAARICYFLNLKGPSIALDTACSSSLVAAHLACESIRRGTCQMAIAGGVTLMSTPFLFVNFSKAGMLSPHGRCKTFDNSADGFVPGEGVGIVVLKGLEQALQEGDHIYAVIKGSEINQDGKTNGITAPSAPSQTALERQVYDLYNINPRTISYIEAHGTATKLGDPIEIQALTAAFSQYTQKRNYCAIGSVKTNIGHTLAAAGAAGLIKVILSLKHKQLPPSLHFNKANEHINFRESPFYVNTQLKEWSHDDNLPRRAAVSSFGFSGTNCHMVVEEAPKVPARASNNNSNGKPYYCIPISAKTGAALTQKIADFSAWLKREKTSHSIADIAYTLHMGRSHLPVRSALVVKDLGDLEKKINSLSAGEHLDDVVVPGTEQQTFRPTPVFKVLAKGLMEELQKAGANGLKADQYKEKLLAAADLYTRGVPLEWENLYGGNGYSRISLPAYPFAGDRYWISGGRTAGQAAGKYAGHGEVTGLHPMVERNISTLQEEKFTTRLTGDEFYLSHHIINGRMVLPGVAYLEMVRAAGELAAERPVRRIRNITWMRPLVLNKKAKDIYINLSLQPGSNIVNFVISSRSEENQRVVHAEGQLDYEAGDKYGLDDQFVDLDAVKQRCRAKMEGDTCYSLFKEKGLQLGPGFRVIRELFSNETEVLSLLKLPEELEQGFGDFVLHPSLLDGVLQSGIGLAGQTRENTSLHIPFSMSDVEILGPFSRICRGLLKVTANPQDARQEPGSCELRLLDKAGKVLLKVKNFLARPFQPAARHSEKSPQREKTTRLYFHGVWEPKKPVKRLEKLPGDILIFDHDSSLFDTLKDRLEHKEDNKKNKGKENEHNRSRLILVKQGEKFQAPGNRVYQINPSQISGYRQLLKRLEPQSSEPLRIIHNWSGGNRETGSDNPVKNKQVIQTQLNNGLYSLFFLSQVLMEQTGGHNNKIEILYLYPGNEDEGFPHYAAVNGFARTIPLENSRFVIKTVEMRTPPGEDVLTASQLADVLLEELKTGMTAGTEIELSYRGQQRWEKVWKEFKPVGQVPGIEPLKKSGVYLITGGMGGLGMIFARFLAKKYNARLVLTGRSQLGANEKTRLRELEFLGAGVEYIQADVSSYEEVKNLVRQAKHRFKTINGIIHSAGLTRDALLQKKREKDFKEVLAPKVDGTRYLDEATREENLDFFVLFSSTSAVLGNIGQSDYAYANSFMDYFAQWREKLRKEGKRFGKTFSINWPLWREGGLKVDRSTEEAARQNLGIGILETEAGLDAFTSILAADEHQVMVLEGDAVKIRQRLGKNREAGKQKSGDGSADEVETRVQPGKDHINQDEISGRIRKDLIKMISGISKVKENRLSSSKNLAEYGFDSISFVELNNAINKKFSLGITPAIFFEYPTLDALTGYLYKGFNDQFLHYYREGEESSNRPVSPASDGNLQPARNTGTRFREANLAGGQSRVGFEPIAIIGMSGVMPQSEDLDIFWKHLEAGNDLITKIPQQRWELGGYSEALASDNDMSDVVWGGFMKEVDTFDALFFGISPREAELMDPQQRIFLETAWKTVEDAGYRVSDLAGTKTGVFVGVSTGDYSDIIKAHAANVEAHMTTGMSHCILANRVSYLFDWHGPSEPIDTACSSALIALHQAVESIRSGNCEMALAGGVNVLLTPGITIGFTKAGMLSPDGRCKTFDKSADGYVRGEGSGAVFLKPLARAVRDKDHIYAVIKGSAVNHGGHASSLTAPNPVAQADLLIEAYEKAGIDPSTVGFIEAHGTGTGLGDPVEINGLKRAFTELYKRRGQDPDSGYCGISAVKTNIGHLEAAAGIAGLLKALLAIKHKKIPAAVHFKELNPYIQLENSPFYIVSETRPWEECSDRENRPMPRRAGVSSFGFGGANAHVVLEEYEKPLHRESHQPPEPQIIVLSAKNTERLKAYAADMVRFLEQDRETPSPPLPSTPDNNTNNVNDNDNYNIDVTPGNIQKEILHFIADIIHVEKDTIDPAENFNEYGLDPVGLSDLAARIDEKYKIEIKGNELTGCLNINQLTQVVLDRQPPPPAPGSQPSPASEQPSLPPALSITDIAHTLRVGREAMEERLAFIITDIPGLKEKLSRFSRGDEQEEIEGLFRGNPEENKAIPGFLLEGNEGKVYLDTVIRERKLEKLAKLWVSGVDIDWNLLYRGTTPARISLPTYPFARERYWVTADKAVERAKIEKPPGQTQPVDSNEIATPAASDGSSDVTGKSFRTLLLETEPRQRREMLESFLIEEISRMLRLNSTQKLNPTKPLVTMGLDSLMALQLKKRIEGELLQDVSVIKFLGGESVADLTGQLLDHLPGPGKENESLPLRSDSTIKETVNNHLQNDIMEGVL